MAAQAEGGVSGRVSPSRPARPADIELGDQLAGDQDRRRDGAADLVRVLPVRDRGLVPLRVRRVAARGRFPPRTDWPLVAVSGVLQMAAYSALTALALTILPPGRASVLAFSTPIWVVPLAAWRLQERASRDGSVRGRTWTAGRAGYRRAVHPRGASGTNRRLRDALGSAAAWAISIVIVRAHRFTASTLALAPWQMAFAACLLLPVAILVEGAPQPIQ